MMKVPGVVPLYHAESYAGRCRGSVQQQLFVCYILLIVEKTVNLSHELLKVQI